jgi:hypothetical protein
VGESGREEGGVDQVFPGGGDGKDGQRAMTMERCGLAVSTMRGYAGSNCMRAAWTTMPARGSASGGLLGAIGAVIVGAYHEARGEQLVVDVRLPAHDRLACLIRACGRNGSECVCGRNRQCGARGFGQLGGSVVAHLCFARHGV